MVHSACAICYAMRCVILRANLDMRCNQFPFKIFNVIIKFVYIQGYRMALDL